MRPESGRRWTRCCCGSERPESAPAAETAPRARLERTALWCGETAPAALRRAATGSILLARAGLAGTAHPTGVFRLRCGVSGTWTAAKGGHRAAAWSQEGNQARPPVLEDQEEPARSGPLRRSPRRSPPEPSTRSEQVGSPLADLDPGHLLLAPRRQALRHQRSQGPHPRPALQRGQEPRHRRALEDEQDAAAACDRR